MRSFLAAFYFLLSTGLFMSELASAEDLSAEVGMNGSLVLKTGERRIGTLNPSGHTESWGGVNAAPVTTALKPGDPNRLFTMKASAKINGQAQFKNENDGVVASYTFTPEANVVLNTLVVSGEFPVEVLNGAKWIADDKNGVFPNEFKDIALFSGAVSKLQIEWADGRALKFAFESPTQVLLQDNRQWNPGYSIRMGPQQMKHEFKKDETVNVKFTLTASKKIALAFDEPFTIVPGADWIALKTDLEIVPGSALDFSKFGQLDVPAGQLGRVIARPDGQFVFEKDPKTARRFYGVNICFSANYLTHEESDRLVERLSRIGYNALRIHHYEGELSAKQADSLTFNAEKLDQLDYLVAACGKRGIYITTDLFVSRPVKWKEVGIDKDGNVPMDTYKLIVPAVPGAYENWKSFTKNLLSHVNPYSKLKWAEDPTIAWLSMINEGNFGNFYGILKTFPEWNALYNQFLKAEYGERAKLEAAWKAELKANEDFGSVAMAGGLDADNPRTRDTVRFLASAEKSMIEKMRKLLVDELGCKALITNSNAWTNFGTDQNTRNIYDYVDDHFYIDHPEFLERPWSLPSKCPNTSPIASGASGGRTTTFTRLFDKPFTISEYNYSAPGRFRGVGGILTGSMGALQGWSAIWRFAYGHNREALFKPIGIDYFDMVADPMGQAAERASICLFLRGDMQAAPHSVAVVSTLADMHAPPSRVPRLSPGWHWAGWVTRIGMQVVSDPKQKLEQTVILPTGWSTSADEFTNAAVAKINPYKPENNQIMQLLKDKGILSANNPTDPAKNLFQSETGEMTINGAEDIMTLDTPKTAGGYAPDGKRLTCAKGGVTIDVSQAGATVWVSALDNEPIAKSKRLLVSHLTDLQNTEIRYGEKARQTLLAWGKLPHLVRNGTAILSIKLENAEKYKIWALSTSGKRMGEVKPKVENGALTFTAQVDGNPEEGARMLYEIAVE